MAEPLYQVELTASFRARLTAIETFLNDADAAKQFDALLDDLLAAVIPNLEQFPRLGRRYLDAPPQSAEALDQLSRWPNGSADRLREYPHGDYLILYLVDADERRVHLLSIRHHRELSFQFFALWPTRPLSAGR